MDRFEYLPNFYLTQFSKYFIKPNLTILFCGFPGENQL